MAKKTTKESKKKTDKKLKTVPKVKVEKPAKKTKAAKTTGTKTKVTVPASPKKKTPVKKSIKEKTSSKEVQKKIRKSPAAREVEVITPPKPIKKLVGYPKKDLEVFKEVILEKRAEIIEQLQVLRDQMMDPSTGQYVNENSPYSLHMAEQGTDAQEREKLYLWAQRENKFLGYLEEALQRIENGTYGLCIECIDEPKNLCPTCPLIPKERLMAVPHTQLCVQVKIAQKK